MGRHGGRPSQEYSVSVCSNSIFLRRRLLGGSTARKSHERLAREIFALVLQYFRKKLAGSFGSRFFQYLRRWPKLGNLASA
jgi:hypothetical protein